MRPDPRAGDAFATFLGLRFEAPGEVRLTIRPELLNSHGMLLGPVGFSLIDYGMAATLFAATTGERFATTGISINYLSSARDGEVVCHSTLDRRGRHAAYLSAELLHESGKLLATAIGTFAILDSPSNVMITQIDCVEGEEEQFNAWFAGHIGEVLAVPGIESVQRYRALEARAPGAAPPLRTWLSVYRLSGDVQSTLDELVRRRRDGEWAPRVSIVAETISMAAFEPVAVDGTPLGL
jgi:uncharacterized protein (TIGR00369 family)